MKRHQFDPLAFCTGLVFAFLAVVFVFDATDAWSTDAAWVPPIVLIAFGLGGVLATLTRRHEQPDDGA